MHYYELSKRKKELVEKKEFLQSKLHNMPEGTLCCSQNGKYYKWDVYYDKDRTKAISKKNPQLAEVMALKRYYSSQLKEVNQELRAVEAYLKDYKKEDEVGPLLRNPEFYRLLKPHFMLEEDAARWTDADYEKNPYHQENLVHETIPGVYVRSKSEALIYTSLHRSNIPFHYEEKLVLGSKVIYPDFTILHPCKGSKFYWEHFGMMDDPIYSKSACSKIQLYAAQGIIPSVQLITTYETKEHPLTLAKIEKIIEEYFL